MMSFNETVAWFKEKNSNLELDKNIIINDIKEELIKIKDENHTNILSFSSVLGKQSMILKK